MKNWNWLDKPITWRSSLRLTGISMLISLVGYGVYTMVIFWDEIINKLDDLTYLVKNKLKLG